MLRMSCYLILGLVGLSWALETCDTLSSNKNDGCLQAAFRPTDGSLSDVYHISNSVLKNIDTSTTGKTVRAQCVLGFSGRDIAGVRMGIAFLTQGVESAIDLLVSNAFSPYFNSMSPLAIPCQLAFYGKYKSCSKSCYSRDPLQRLVGVTFEPLCSEAYAIISDSMQHCFPGHLNFRRLGAASFTLLHLLGCPSLTVMRDEMVVEVEKSEDWRSCEEGGKGAGRGGRSRRVPSCSGRLRLSRFFQCVQELADPADLWCNEAFNDIHALLHDAATKWRC